MIKTLFLAAALATTFQASAQSDYKPVLKSTFTVFDTTYTDMSAKAAAGNKLILIAKKYPDAWAPNYYAAYSRLQLSYLEKDEARKDAYVDDAEIYIGEVVRILGKQTDETHVLSAMAANARLAVKPQSRWQKYGKIFDSELDSARAINANNPRIYLQRGISKFYTPKMFGGGKKAAQPYFDRAATLFAKETDGDLEKPFWGKQTNDWFLAQIKGDDKD